MHMPIDGIRRSGGLRPPGSGIGREALAALVIIGSLALGACTSGTSASNTPAAVPTSAASATGATATAVPPTPNMTVAATPSPVPTTPPTPGLTPSPSVSVPASPSAVPTQTPGPSPVASPSVIPTNAPSASPRPGTAGMKLVGDTGLAGPITVSTITCQYPQLNGESIIVQGGTADPKVSASVTLRQESVVVQLSSGSGADYRSRYYSGPGPKVFDAAKGGQLDTKLTEGTVTGQKPGDIGALTKVTGSVDCQGQTPGTSTIKVVGDTASGALDGKMPVFRVLCYGPESKTVVGIVQAPKTFMFVAVQANGDKVTLYMSPATGGSESYSSTSPNPVTYSPDGFKVSTDASSVDAAGKVLNTVHVNGAATCGS